MKQYSINHDLQAFKAYARRQNIDLDRPDLILSRLHFLAGVKNEQIGNKQAWVLTDEDGNKWLQIYHTIVSVKWNDGTFERLGKWSVTTSKHQTYFERNF